MKIVDKGLCPSCETYSYHTANVTSSSRKAICSLLLTENIFTQVCLGIALESGKHWNREESTEHWAEKKPKAVIADNTTNDTDCLRYLYPLKRECTSEQKTSWYQQDKPLPILSLARLDNMFHAVPESATWNPYCHS